MHVRVYGPIDDQRVQAVVVRAALTKNTETFLCNKPDHKLRLWLTQHSSLTVVILAPLTLLHLHTASLGHTHCSRAAGGGSLSPLPGCPSPLPPAGAGVRVTARGAAAAAAAATAAVTATPTSTALQTITAQDNRSNTTNRPCPSQMQSFPLTFGSRQFWARVAP